MKYKIKSFSGALFLLFYTVFFCYGCSSKNVTRNENFPEEQIIINVAENYFNNFLQSNEKVKNSTYKTNFSYFCDIGRCNYTIYSSILDDFFKNYDIIECRLTSVSVIDYDDEFSSVGGSLTYKYLLKNSSYNDLQENTEYIEIGFIRDGAEWKANSISGRNNLPVNFPPRATE